MALKLFLVISGCYFFVAGEIFTSMEHTNTLVKTEEAMIDAFKRIIKSEEDKVEHLKSLVNELTELHKGYNAENLDPISAFKLIRRLSEDWNEAVEISTSRELIYDYLDVFAQIKSDHMYPTKEDVHGAAGAIIRLQEFYTLNTNDLVNGQLRNINSYSLTALECYEVGLYCHDQWKYQLMREWFSASLSRYKSEMKHAENKKYNDGRHLDWDIYEYLPRAIFMDGDVDTALKVTNEILQIYPTHQKALHYRILFKEVIKERDNNKKVEIEK